MKLFACQACGNLLYFENVRCESCGRTLGFIPARTELSALEEAGDAAWSALADGDAPFRFCRNADFGVCNWLVPADGRDDLCLACRHNRTIPDLSVPGNAGLWAKIEVAKRRLFYSLLRWRLPLAGRQDDPVRGLAFDFLADPPESHATAVMTGHDDGLITLAIREADDAEREKIRLEMGEPYRTLLGHFRHESGHYFWDRLVAPNEAMLATFRDLFGDERTDYAEALQRHYGSEANAGWMQSFVSGYASSHPWEDFAESWAHYMHIVDTLETAGAFGISVRPRLAPERLSAEIGFDPYRAEKVETLIDAWLPLEFATNSLNRSMGHMDFYPFILSGEVIAKLGFVHSLIHASAGSGGT
jgi:hypothetical protein